MGILESQIEEESQFEKSPVKKNRFKVDEFANQIYAKGMSEKLNEQLSSVKPDKKKDKQKRETLISVTSRYFLLEMKD